MVEKTDYNSNKNIKCQGINLTFNRHYETHFQSSCRDLVSCHAVLTGKKLNELKKHHSF